MRELPPRRCSAKTTAGDPCGHWRMVGSDVCQTHGGMAPQVRAAALRRVSLAEALARADRRPPAEILADTLHTADVMLRRAVEATGAGLATVDELAGVVGHLERAEQFARSVIGLGIEERRTRVAEEQGQAMFDVFSRVLGALGLSEEQRALVPELLRREIGALVAGERPAARPALAAAPPPSTVELDVVDHGPVDVEDAEPLAESTADAPPEPATAPLAAQEGVESAEVVSPADPSRPAYGDPVPPRGHLGASPSVTLDGARGWAPMWPR